ncbi:thiamine phosphate synthase [Fodinibius halophilus]|uniref:Thiamine-phosphate synthase n=1 Tax=Fodinibius halophilus TaxID=1736908 RepID=A0A6M1T3G3_9BACT|nr:thiamine phosphate synthase [Fodinibius halophilus]
MKNNRVDFRYYLITDRRAPSSSVTFLETIEEACSAGVQAVQLREKDLPGGLLYDLGNEVREITNQYDTKLFVNGRPDVAKAIGADGVHCPEGGIPPSVIKSYWPDLTIGVSVHSEEVAERAEQEEADFLLFGPVYYTASKVKYGEPQGIDRLKEIAEQSSLPVFAVGGITPEKVTPCLQAGAFGVAGISAIMEADDVTEKVSEFEKKLGQL